MRKCDTRKVNHVSKKQDLEHCTLGLFGWQELLHPWCSLKASLVNLSESQCYEMRLFMGRISEILQTALNVAAESLCNSS